MAGTIELFERARRAVGTLERHSWAGQIEKEVYTARRSILDRAGVHIGKWVHLVAVGEGAIKLSGQDKHVKCIVFERNPNLVGLRDAVLLRVDTENGRGKERIKYTFRKGASTVIDRRQRRIAQRILGNIADLQAR